MVASAGCGSGSGCMRVHIPTLLMRLRYTVQPFHPFVDDVALSFHAGYRLRGGRRGTFRISGEPRCLRRPFRAYAYARPGKPKKFRSGLCNRIRLGCLRHVSCASPADREISPARISPLYLSGSGFPSANPDTRAGAYPIRTVPVFWFVPPATRAQGPGSGVAGREGPDLRKTRNTGLRHGAPESAVPSAASRPRGAS